jgi:hypothetical protein
MAQWPRNVVIGQGEILSVSSTQTLTLAPERGAAQDSRKYIGAPFFLPEGRKSAIESAVNQVMLISHQADPAEYVSMHVPWPKVPLKKGFLAVAAMMRTELGSRGSYLVAMAQFWSFQSQGP